MSNVILLSLQAFRREARDFIDAKLATHAAEAAAEAAAAEERTCARVDVVTLHEEALQNEEYGEILRNALVEAESHENPSPESQQKGWVVTNRIEYRVNATNGVVVWSGRTKSNRKTVSLSSPDKEAAFCFVALMDKLLADGFKLKLARAKAVEILMDAFVVNPLRPSSQHHTSTNNRKGL